MNQNDRKFLSIVNVIGRVRALDLLDMQESCQSASPSAPIHVRSASKAKSFSPVSNADKVRAFIKSRKRSAWSLGDCALATGLTKSQVTNTLSGVYGLVGQGAVRPLGNGRYIKA